MNKKIKEFNCNIFKFKTQIKRIINNMIHLFRKNLKGIFFNEKLFLVIKIEKR